MQRAGGEPTGGDVTTWEYQAATGLLTRKQYHDGQGTDYTYDALRRLATRTWAREVASQRLTTTYAYSTTTGEMLSVTYSDSTPNVAMSYDRLGRQTSVTDATGTRTFDYDATKLRLTTETLPAYFGERVLTRAYQGTGTGQLPGRYAGFSLGTSTDPDEDYVVSYGYDNVGRFKEVDSPAGTFNYGRVSDSDLLASITLPSHDVLYTYETNRDLRTEVRNRLPSGGTVRSVYGYGHDEIGRRVHRTQSGSVFAADTYERFGYNPRSEVIENKRHEGTNPVNYATDPEVTGLRRLYSYDHLGNRLTSQAGTATARTYQANELNQYTQVSGFSSQPSYDEDGNQTATGEGWYYQWDAENRLVRVRNFETTPVNGSQVIDFVYDYQSRRVRKTVEDYDGANWTVIDDRKFIYDSWNLISEYSLVASNWELGASYTWGLDLSGSLQGAGGVGGLLAVMHGTDSFYPTYDANGNVSEYLDASGAVEAHFQYDAFGRTVVSSGTDLERFVYRFSTKFEDAETGLYYYGYRYHNSDTGRWLGRDPIEENGGINLYGVVGNNLVDQVDYLGMRPCCGGEKLKQGWGCCTGPSGNFDNGIPFNPSSSDCCRHGFTIEKRRKSLGDPCCGNSSYAWQYLPVWRGVYASEDDCISAIREASWVNREPGDLYVDAGVYGGGIVMAVKGASIVVVAAPGGAVIIGRRATRAYARRFCQQLICQNPWGGM